MNNYHIFLRNFRGKGIVFFEDYDILKCVNEVYIMTGEKKI